MSRTMPDLTGFDVVQLPSIEERLALPWGKIYSIPEPHLRLVNDEILTKYDFKIRVFQHFIGDWRLDIPQIAESEFGGSFKTQKEAFDKACEYLKNKK